MKPAEIGEDALIRQLLQQVPHAPVAEGGPGDDCAVVPLSGGVLQLLKTDALVEGIHFDGAAAPERIGWKAIARVMSDFAAMGGKPDRFLVTIGIPADECVARLEGIYRGIGNCLRTFGGGLAGGETTSLPAGNGLFISVAATGTVVRSRLVWRSGGKPGDVIFVTGTLGGSLRGKHLDFTPRLAEAAWLVENFKPSAMMDLSDGLGSDLPRLAAMSSCGYEIEDRNIPVSDGSDLDGAWCDGEDFELLFTISPGSAAALQAAWGENFPQLALSAIGNFTEPLAGISAHRDGWDHFR